MRLRSRHPVVARVGPGAPCLMISVYFLFLLFPKLYCLPASSLVGPEVCSPQHIEQPKQLLSAHLATLLFSYPNFAWYQPEKSELQKAFTYLGDPWYAQNVAKNEDKATEGRGKDAVIFDTGHFPDPSEQNRGHSCRYINYFKEAAQ